MNTKRLLQLFTKAAFAVVMVFALSASTVMAQSTYYVSASAGNDNFNGSNPNVVSGLVGPFKTIAKALTVAVDGDTVVIEAGTYAEDVTVAADLTISATASGANSTVTVGVGGGTDLTFNSNPISLNGGGATITTAGGAIDFESGTVTLAAGALTVPAGGTVERTDGAVSGSAPLFAGATNMLYNSASATTQTAGVEIPASLSGGTLTITKSGAANPISFPAGLTAGAIFHTGASDANFEGAVTASGLITASGGDVAFAALTANGGLTTSGTSFSATSLVLDDGDAITNSSASFTVTGTTTIQMSATANQNPIVNTGGMSLNDVTFTFVGTNAGAAGNFARTQTIDNNGAASDLTINGTLTEAASVSNTFSAAVDAVTAPVILNNVNPTARTVFANAVTLSGDVTNTGAAPSDGVYFNGGGTLNADLDNDGTITIGSGATLEMTSDVAALFDIDDVNGAGTLLISGDTNISTTIDSDGNVTISGDGNVAGAVAVDGNFTVSGDGDMGATVTVGGDYVLSGDGDVTGVTNVSGSATVTGVGNDFGANFSAGGNVTLGTSATGDGPDITGNLSVGNDLVIGNDTDITGNLTADNVTVNNVLNLTSVGAVHNFSEALTMGSGATAGLAAGASTITVGSTSIDPLATFTLGAGNTYISQGNFTGGVFIGTGAGAELRFDLPSGNTTFAPGPNTAVNDFRVTGNERTLIVTQSFEVQNDFFVADDATIDLTNELVRMTGVAGPAPFGTVEVATDAKIITSENTGAISFEGPGGGAPSSFLITSDAPGQDIGTITNLVVNTSGASATTDVQTDEDMTITGVLSLVSGGFEIGAGTTTTFSTDGAGISRNIGSATTVVTETGALAGVYDLTYTGTGAGAPGSAVGDEYTDPGTNRIDDLTLDLTAGFVNLAEAGGVGINGNFTVSATSSATLTNDLSVPGNIAVNAVTATDGNVAAGGGTLTATGAGAAHTINGVVGAPVVFTGAGSTVTGNSSDTVASNLTNVTIGAGDAVTITNVQNILGDLTVNGALTMGLSNANGVAAGDQQILGDVLVDESGSLTLSSNVDVLGGGAFLTGGFAVGNGGVGVASLDLAGNTLLLSTVASSFQADGDATIGTTGTIQVAAATTIGSQAAGTTPAVLPTVNIDAPGIFMSSNMAVGGVLDVDEDFNDGGFTLTLSGDATFVDTTGDTEVNIAGGGTFVTTGTTLTMTEDVEVTNFTVNSSSTTTLASNNATTHEVYVNGIFRMQSGTLDLGDQDLVVDGTAGATVVDWDGGSITAASGELIINDDNDASAIDFDTDAAAVSASIPNLTVMIAGAAAVDGDDGFQLNTGDAITVTGTLRLTGGFIQTNFAAPTVDGSLTVADGARIIRNLGTLEQVPTFGGPAIDVEYDAVVVTGNELPSIFDELQLDAAVTFANGATATVNTVDFNAAGLNIDDGVATQTESLTVTDGGTVEVSVTGPIVGGAGAAGSDDGEFVYAGAFNLVFDGSATTDGIVWNGTPATVNVSGPGAVTATLGSSVTATDVTVGAGETLAMGANNLTILGNMTQNGAVTSVTGTLAFAGTAAQTYTVPAGGNTLPNVTFNNGAGVAIAGGNLNVSALATFSQGVVTTGATNALVLDHTSTGAQGFVQTAGGVSGNVRKFIIGAAAAGSPADRMTFPTATADGTARPASITFNQPNEIGGPFVAGPAGFNASTGISLTVNHVGTSPGGNNNLPLTTIDNLGNDLTIARYPGFHWLITASSTLSPSVDYDVELNGAGFAEFAGEDIERTRTIRRQGGATTNFWFLVGGGVPANNDNFAVSATNPVTVVRDAVGALNAGNGVLFTMGLESNMTVTDPAAVSVNAGATGTVDLTTVFGGGTGAYSYAITSGDATVATGAAAANTLTVTGVAAGSTTLTVVATDILNDTRTATVSVTVNPALAAGAVDAVALNAGGTSTLDLSTVFTGGADPVTYVVTSDDAAVATGAEATGTLTITAVAAGTATVSVTATDGTGQTATATVAVSVNAALAVTNPATITLLEGASSTVDLSTVFAGGDGTYTYTVTSASDANVTGAEASGTLTVTAVEAYAAGTTIGTTDVTVVATDGIGDSVTATVVVDVLPVLGDLDGSGAPSAASASLALDYFLGLTTLTAKQQTAADFNSDGFVTPFDAALIFDAFFNGKTEIAAYVASDLTFGELVRETGMVSIPVQLTGNLNEVVSASFSALIDPAFATVESVVSELGEGWMVKHVVSEDGQLRIAIAGFGEIEADGVVATINLQLVDSAPAFNLSAEGAVNNNPVANIDAVEVVELPETFALQGNYPNPFNPSTTVQFDLPETADVEIQIFDMLGRQVMALPSQTIQAGAKRSVQLNASQLASGSYFYRVIAKMESKTLVESGRMMLVK